MCVREYTVCDVYVWRMYLGVHFEEVFLRHYCGWLSNHLISVQPGISDYVNYSPFGSIICPYATLKVYICVFMWMLRVCVHITSVRKVLSTDVTILTMNASWSIPLYIGQCIMHFGISVMC